MRRGAAVAVLAATASLGLIGAPVLAHGHRPAAREGRAAMSAHRPRATITGITATTVTLAMAHHRAVNMKTISLAGLRVDAGPYSSTPALLMAGERVSLHKVGGQAILTVYPAAAGVLTVGASGDTVTVGSRVLTLSNSHPVLLGMSAAASGTRVLVFGTRAQTNLQDVALAAQPAVWAATVQANQNGVLPLSTSHGTLTYTLSTGASSRWSKAPTGMHLRVLVSPVSHTVLAILAPRHVVHLAYGVLTTAIAGTVTSVTSGTLTVRNALGTEAVDLSGWHVTVQWAHHGTTPLAAVKVGWDVIVLAHSQAHQLIVRIVRTPAS